MTFLLNLRRFASEWHAAREAARTERAISGLSVESLKDIGWPTRVRVNPPHRFRR